MSLHPAVSVIFVVFVVSVFLLPLTSCSALDSASASSAGRASPPADDGKLRIIAFGAHPDDCEIKAGGVGSLWAAAGHHVKFVSVTNGDIGHWRERGEPLARRRLAEVEEAARILGIEATQVLNIHDGELEPTLEHRKTITRLIRDWHADIVLAPRPNDYHPDHRYTGILVQDAAYMVTVPFFCPDTPHLERNPLFVYYSDRFENPNPFDPEWIVSIDSILEKKLDALGIMISQFFEGGATGNAGLIPDSEEGREQRARQVHDAFAGRFGRTADKYRERLVELHGEKGRSVQHAEAFEVCEYGRQPTAEELRELFPSGL